MARDEQASPVFVGVAGPDAASTHWFPCALVVDETLAPAARATPAVPDLFVAVGSDGGETRRPNLPVFLLLRLMVPPLHPLSLHLALCEVIGRHCSSVQSLL